MQGGGFESVTLNQIDHLVYGVPNVDAAVDRLHEALGVRAVPGGRHRRWGTRNALLSLGPETYLEILGPDPDREERGSPVGWGLDRLAEPRLMLWALAADDLERRVEAAARRGVRLGEVQSGGREKPDGTVLSWRLTDPEAILGDGVVPFLIDWGVSEHPAIDAPKGCLLSRLRAEHPEPDRIRAMLDALGVSLPVTAGPIPALVATIRAPRGEVELR